MLEQKLKALIPQQLPAFIGELPSTAKDAVAIMLFDGNFNTEYFGEGTLCKPVAKVVVRHHSYEIGSNWITLVKQALHRYHDDYFKSILMVGYPRYLGKDPQKLHEFQVVFSITIKE